jgi:ADP-heptose:LPS heptosyltransferase
MFKKLARRWARHRSANDRPGIPAQVLTGNIALPPRVMQSGLSVKSVLLLKLDHIGDFFVSMRAFEILRNAWPDARFTLVCGSWNVELASLSGYFDRIVSHDYFPDISEKRHRRSSDDYAELRPKLVDHFDVAIDLRHDPDTRPFLAVVDASFRAGYESKLLPKGLDLALPNAEDRRSPESALHCELRLSILARAVVEVFSRQTEHPVRRLVRPDLLPETPGTGPYAVLAPGAGSELRRWEIDKFIDLGHCLRQEFGLRLLIVGPPSDHDRNSRLVAAFEPGEVMDMTGSALTLLPTVVGKVVRWKRYGRNSSGRINGRPYCVSVWRCQQSSRLAT